MLLKRLAVALVALLLALVPFAANAQTGISLQTGFQVQNLGSGTATVTVTYYNQADGSVAATQTETIAQGGSFTYFGATMKVAAGFKGSVVISADQPIAAISNVIGTLTAVGGSTQGSYNGFSAGATALNLPIIQRGNAGIDTFVAVQNAGEVDANVSIAFTPGLFGTPGTPQTATIKKGQSFIFDQNTNNGLGARFVGSATVTSTNGQPIVATVSQVGQGGSKALSIYDGFTAAAAAPSVLLPLIQSFNGPGSTFVGIQVQNAGTAPTGITVTFTPNTLTTGSNLCATPAAQTSGSIAPGGAYTLLSGTAAFANPANCRYVGSAVVTNSANQPLVAVVNQLDATGTNKAGSSYEAFNPAAATKNVSLPLLQANNSNIFSGIQIQNTTGTAANVTLTFSPNTQTSATPPQVPCGALAARNVSVPANGSVTLLTPQLVPTAGCRYVGSATVTSDQNVVAVVNQLQLPGAGDALSTYNGFNQ
jgi:hypothetical protein